MDGIGAWSLLPPALAIIFAMVTRRVYQSLLLGIFSAGFLLAGLEAARSGQNVGMSMLAAAGEGFLHGVGWIIGSVANSGHAAVIALTLFLGAIIALMQRSGAIKGFGDAAMRYANTRRKGQSMAWGVGALFLAIDDYFHVIAAGTIFRPVTDRLKISREKLAYIIDSTAAPMVILVPVSTWAGFILGIERDAFAANDITAAPFDVFLTGIGHNFYAIMTVLFVGVIALTNIDFGAMRKAERRAAAGRVLAPNAKPLVAKELTEMEVESGATPRARNLLLPVAFLFANAFFMLYATGRNDGAGFWGAIKNTPTPELALALAAFLTLIFTVVLYRSQGMLKGESSVETSLEGFKAMVPALAMLVLAWGIGAAVSSADDGGIGLGGWLADTVGSDLGAAVVPLLAFLLSAIIAFATGTSFGTFGIMIPVTIGIVSGAPDGVEWLGATLAATVGGAVFGDHCSPISDTTVLSSMAAQSDHIDHVRTQLPYAVTVAAIATMGYGVLALSGSVMLAWLANGLAFAFVVFAMFLNSRAQPDSD